MSDIPATSKLAADSVALSDRELEDLIKGGESDHVEFKEALSGNAPDKIREAICAFANDLPGRKAGYVIVGIKDSGSPANYQITDEILRQLADMRSDGNIIPPPSIVCEKRFYRNSEIAVVTVLASDSPPVKYKGTILIRTGPRRGIATAQEEGILNGRRRHGMHPFDIAPVPRTHVGDLDQTKFMNEYLPNAFDRNILRMNDRSVDQRLATSKMIAAVDDKRVTVLGLMVLGFRVRNFIPGAFVQFLRIGGSSLSDPILDEQSIDGTVTDIVPRIDDKLRSHNARAVEIATSDIEKIKERYPLAALQQLVRNAIMHRDYETTYAPIRITWFNDRIEIQNPGGPFGSVNERNFAQPGFTDYRNPNLAETIKVLGYVQRFGVGIPIAQRLIREAGDLELEFTVEPGHVLATVRVCHL